MSQVRLTECSRSTILRGLWSGAAIRVQPLRYCGCTYVQILCELWTRTRLGNATANTAFARGTENILRATEHPWLWKTRTTTEGDKFSIYRIPWLNYRYRASGGRRNLCYQFGSTGNTLHCSTGYLPADRYPTSTSRNTTIRTRGRGT